MNTIPIIEISDLSKSFGEVKAVQSISFKVNKGELFAFLGVNGAGKSTTINIMCGQLSKDRGTRLSDTLAEIDMIETLTFTDRNTPNIHKWYNNGETLLHTQYNNGTGNKIQQYIFDSENLCDEFHIYGFEWTETEIKMYIDRELYATYDITTDYEKSGDIVGSMAAFNDPTHIIIGMQPPFEELGAYDYYGDGSGFATDDTAFDTPYSIDWIRLYQKDDTGMLLK